MSKTPVATPNPKSWLMPLTRNSTKRKYPNRLVKPNGMRMLFLSMWGCLYLGFAHAATLLPPGEQQFFSNTGVPLTSGTVTFYYPNTTTPKTTWQNSSQTVANTNPVVLNAAGRAVIYGSGVYRQIVKDSLGNTIWDRTTADTSVSQTSWGGTSGGSANAQTVVASNFSNVDGQQIGFIAGFTNTASATLNPGTGPITIVKDTSTGPTNLTGGEIVVGNLIEVVYDSNSGVFHLVSQPTTSNLQASLASASTTNLGSVASRNVLITGVNTINSFGSSANTTFPYFNIKFNNVLTLTFNSTSMILPGITNITTAENDTAVAMYLGSGNWQIVQYTRANGQSLKPYADATPTSSGSMSAADKAAYMNRAYATYGSAIALTTVIPTGANPTIADGTQILSATITPSSLSGIIRVRFMGYAGSDNASRRLNVAVFRGSTLIQVGMTQTINNASVYNLSLEVDDAPASIAAQTYTVRVGPTAGSMYMNGSGDGVIATGGFATLTLEQVVP